MSIINSAESPDLIKLAGAIRSKKLRSVLRHFRDKRFVLESDRWVSVRTSEMWISDSEFRRLRSIDFFHSSEPTELYMEGTNSNFYALPCTPEEHLAVLKYILGRISHVS